MKRFVACLLVFLGLVSVAGAHSFGWNLDYDANGDMYNLRIPMIADTKSWLPLPNSYIKVEPVLTAPRSALSNIRYNHVAALVGFRMPVAGGTLVVEGGPFYRLGRMVQHEALATTISVYDTTTNTVTSNTSVTNTVTDTITNTTVNTVNTNTTVMTYPLLPLPDVISSTTTYVTDTFTAVDSNTVWGAPVTTVVTDSVNNTVTATSVAMSSYSKYQEPILTWGINAGWSVSW